jgi:hypothetical protein
MKGAQGQRHAPNLLRTVEAMRAIQKRRIPADRGRRAAVLAPRTENAA